MSFVDVTTHGELQRARDETSASVSAWHCACEICATTVTSEPDYFAMAFGDARHFAATSEDIADALGFCPRHGAALIQNERLLCSAGSVLEGAAARVLPLLLERRFGDEKFQQVYFSAHHACPACVYERRAAGRHAARLARQYVAEGTGLAECAAPETLCIPHFHLVARGLKAERRMLALPRFAHAVESSAHALGVAVSATDRSDHSPTNPVLLADTLKRVVGPMTAQTTDARTDLADPIQEFPSLERSLGCAVCSVCLEIERARQRWLSTVPFAAAHHLDGWLFFPTCPTHVAEVAAMGDIELTGAVCAHALHVAAEHLQQQLRVLVRTAESEAELAAARIVRWGRRPRRKKTDPPRPPQPRIVRCAACERIAIAELQATSKLLRLLRADKHQRTFEGGFGLCMKHHAQAYLMSSRGDVRVFVAQDQRRRLSDLVPRVVADASTPGPSRLVGEPALALLSDWRRFCGFG